MTLVYGAQGFWALEVKNSAKVYPVDLKPLEAFLVDYPMAQGILLYRGKDKLLQKGILCLPVDDFLKNLRPDNPLWEK